jgi:putative membrane protein
MEESMFADGMHGAGGWNWMGAGWMMFIWVILITASVWAVYRLTRSSQDPTSQAARIVPTPREPESALEILGRRFASGELDIDEYSERRARIEHDRAS